MSVADTIRLAKQLNEQGLIDLKKGTVLSSNVVTGYALNVPIFGTCKPTKVCAKNCYAAIPHKPIAMKVEQTKQRRVYNTIKADPQGVATKIVRELRRKVEGGSVRFLRWNGVGDLFPESIECLTAVADALPSLSIWVVTRIPEQAANVPHRENVFVHFSLDASSLDRYDDVLRRSPSSRHLFFSYTADKGEAEPPARVFDLPISVFFSDLYGSDAPPSLARVSCPLNGAESMSAMCEQCGRCWNGDAVKIRDGETVDVYIAPRSEPKQGTLL